MLRFAPQARCRHGAIGEFERCGDRKPQQRFIANSSGIRELDHYAQTLFARFPSVPSPEFLQRHFAAPDFAHVDDLLGSVADLRLVSAFAVRERLVEQLQFSRKIEHAPAVLILAKPPVEAVEAFPMASEVPDRGQVGGRDEIVADLNL